MPQVDKATFLPLVFWTMIFFVAGYLFLSSTFLYGFLTELKVGAKRALAIYGSAQAARRLTSNLLQFPWISLL